MVMSSMQISPTASENLPTFCLPNLLDVYKNLILAGCDITWVMSPVIFDAWITELN